LKLERINQANGAGLAARKVAWGRRTLIEPCPAWTRSLRFALYGLTL